MSPLNESVEAYRQGVRDGAAGALKLLRRLLECGFGLIDALDVVEEWVRKVQRNACISASAGSCGNADWKGEIKYDKNGRF